MSKHGEHCHDGHCGEEIEVCSCGHCHEKEEKGKLLPIIVVIFSALLIAASFLPFVSETAGKLMLTAAMLISGLPVFADAVKALSKFKINESLLLVIAVIAAFFIGEFFEAAVVSVLFRVGELMEDYAEDKSRKSIEAIFGIVSDTANLVMPDGSYKSVDADDVNIGDTVAVLPHEILPVDGTVVKGFGSVDASALTGESMPVEVSEGSAVSSGMINGENTLYIKATAVKEQSSAARIAEMVEEAAAKKGDAQRAVTNLQNTILRRLLPRRLL